MKYKSTQKNIGVNMMKVPTALQILELMLTMLLMHPKALPNLFCQSSTCSMLLQGSLSRGTVFESHALSFAI
ncbi:hypothetical protein L916_04367 [Phytophthora nicotianae]|uniref:Uncharacterized protein n=1 Tax=Phytophthora nicotianae TaxID=4792 RepID=W2JGR0_PHYNI|nr:hypothetical protein L916_04367 [Phytophthora nicotianae]